MSEHFLVFIPADPPYVPGGEAQRAAIGILSSAILADDVAAETDDQIVFHDCGASFEHVRCPSCATLLDHDLWSGWMDSAYSTETDGFRLEVLDLPCGHAASLNDLCYELEQGFARFSLTATNPRARLPDDLQAALESALGCKLKRIHRKL